MFVPPYDALLKALGTSPEDIDKQSEVTISVKLFKHLLRFAVEKGDFNEEGYLAENPDLADALRKKNISSARDHFVTTGYWESRRGATPPVDESWYLKANPDIAASVRKKTLGSAKEHYLLTGVFEFRPPNEAYVDECWTWKNMAWRKPRVRV